MERFSSASAATRVEAILDSGSFTPLSKTQATTTITGHGSVDGRAVWVAAIDPGRARGALGAAEAEALCTWFQAARQQPHPVLLLIDSAGAKVDEGLGALGAFRRLFRDALLTRIAGIPMLAVLGRSCFGGSSMLACVCEQRVYSSQTLLAVSGPGVIEALTGKAELDASDSQQVRALMGAQVRSTLGPEEQVIPDEHEAFRAAVSAWVSQARAVPAGSASAARHEQLRQRLQATIGVDPNRVVYERTTQGGKQLIPAGYQRLMRGALLLAPPAAGSAKPAFVGVVGAAAIGAETCWYLADELRRLHDSNPASPVILLLDASGHAATRRDEALMLSAYLAHLSIVAAELGALGHRMVLWITGAAAGAIYVAFASPAQHVSALASASIRILPEAAVQKIVGATVEETRDPATWVRTGVVDALLDHRLEPHTDSPDSLRA